MMPSTAILFSAGLDSTVLAVAEARRGPVHPIYVATGLAWESEERDAVDRLLVHPTFAGRLAPIAHLEFTARDLYPDSHWAIRGDPPDFDTPDEEVFLTGRNVMLLGKAAIYCAQHEISRIALAPLMGNPFPDATVAFFDAMSRAMTLGLDYPLDVVAPFLTKRKPDVVRLGLELGVPLDLTLSCMNPTSGRHCGRCSKCRERRDAFLEAGVTDDTRYEVTPAR